ncbi:ankyrin repeat domain-containing protein [Paraflavisolibacter sp. H34]|uniref:ankyrin repeat domain-containing protein n=1 Tax=Huijunlia imazamoxiresistens TaxID=3127457 RepID=UPI00301791C8
MKYLFIGLLAGMTLGAQAQREPQARQSSNSLLNATFWQAKPGADLVKAEVAKGQNPAEMNAMSFDPVVLAINNDAPNESVIYLLEQKGNGVNKPTHDGRTYLFWAAGKGNVELMQYLLSKGARVDVEDSHGMTVVTYAAAAGQQNTAVYDLCVKNGVNLKNTLNHDGANALLLAVGADNDLKLTAYFQSKGLDLKSRDAAGSTAFDYAARGGNIGVMKALRAKGVAPTDNALLLAAQGSRRGGNPLEVFQYLESIGIKPTVVGKDGQNALHAIVRRPDQMQIIRYFLDKGVNVNQVNEDGNTVFMNAAAFNRDTATIALLLPLAKNLDQANKSGATALALAVRGNAPEVVNYLLKKGANVQATDAKGNNLVYYLFESYTPRTAKDFEPKLQLLQARGVNFAAPQKDGNTVYHLAVAKNDLALLKRVQAFGADVNAKNAEGLTALHKAAMVSKDGSLLQFLLSAGAQKDVKTSFNETAFDLASENEFLAKEKVSVDFLK